MAHAEVSAGMLDLVFAQQIDLPASLAPLGRSGDDLLDRWDGRTLARTAGIAGEVVAYAGGVPEPNVLRLAAPTDVAGAALAAAVTATFLVDLDALQELAGRDERVATLVRRHPGVIPVLFRDPFTALVRAISAQQVNLRWAATIRRRLAQTYGRSLEVAGTVVYRLEPERLAHATTLDLRELQLTSAKARSLIACAQADRAGELELTQLERATDDELIAHLTRLPGIGTWSAEWFLARTLGRPRVVAGDLGVRKAVARTYGLSSSPSEIEVRRLTAHWGKAAAMAQALALHELALSPRPAPLPVG